MAQHQYQPVNVDGRLANLLVWPQAIAGRQSLYEVLDCINFQNGQVTSGQAFLYRGRDAQSGLPVALKQPLHPRDPAARKRHERECFFLLHKAQGHPHIVRALEAFNDGREMFLCEEWLDGETLQQEVGRRGPLPDDEVTARLRTLCQAVHFVNANGYYFRDLNEGNVMVTARGLALIDFGGILERYSPRSTYLQPPSPAPEIAAAAQRRKSPTFTLQSEVYALAALGYYLLTGQFVPDDRQAQPLSPPRACNPQVGAALEALLLQGLDIDPRQRPGSPLTFKRELEKLVAAKAQAVNLPPQPAPPMPVNPLPSVPLPPVSSGAPAPLALPRAFRGVGWAGRRMLLPVGLSALLVGGLFQGARSLPSLSGRKMPSRKSAPSAPKRSRTRLASGRPSSTPPALLGALPPPAAAAAAPVATPAPPPPARVSLWGARIHLREQPGLDSRIIGPMSEPKQVRVLGEQNGWFNVETDDGTQGWMWGAYILETKYQRGELLTPARLSARTAPVGEKALITAASAQSATLLFPEGESVTAPLTAVNLRP